MTSNVAITGNRERVRRVGVRAVGHHQHRADPADLLLTPPVEHGLGGQRGVVQRGAAARRDPVDPRLQLGLRLAELARPERRVHRAIEEHQRHLVAVAHRSARRS
jgi:hypothetical protein